MVQSGLSDRAGKECSLEHGAAFVSSLSHPLFGALLRNLAKVANGGVDGGKEVNLVVAIVVARAGGEHNDFGHTTFSLANRLLTAAEHCGRNALSDH